MISARSLLISVLFITCSFNQALAQAKSQFILLQEIGEGSTFDNYYGVKKDGDSYKGTLLSSKSCKLKFKNNIHGKLSTIVMIDAKTDKTIMNTGFSNAKPNHYTEPSALYSDERSETYVYLDGILYTLKNVKDPQNITTFKIEQVHILTKPAKGDHTSGKSAVKAFKNKDHEIILKQYFKDMKVIQDNATANFTPDIIAEADAIENNDKAKEQAIIDRNAEYWASAEGQRKRGEIDQAKITFINDTGSDLGMCYGQGVSTVLKAGEKHTFSCTSGKVYRGEKIPNNSTNLKRTDKVLLDLKGTNCGAQIKASSVI